MSKDKRKRLDLSLYLVTDRNLALGRPLEGIVAAAVRGGVRCVQLREKNLETREFVAEARRIKELLATFEIPLIINDRIDVALAAGADGVHLGQSDMEISDARGLLGSTAIIGVSAECLEDGIRAEQQGADYIGVSPIYASTTKTDTATPLGLTGLAHIRARVKLPLVGIGGISAANVTVVIEAGADGIAVVSAIISAPDPEKAAAEISKGIAGMIAGRGR